MTTDVIESTVSNNAARRRYEAIVAPATTAGFVRYELTRELLVLTHTRVEPAFEGRGIGSVLARSAVEDIRDRGLRALVVCPFILGWLRRHPGYFDVLYNAPKLGQSHQDGPA